MIGRDREGVGGEWGGGNAGQTEDMIYLGHEA
jgi:hypothetical protein